jgi:fumarylacetoacetase
MIDHTHNIAATSWVASAAGHPQFPVQNLPFGIFSSAQNPIPRIGVAIGDHILDLSAIADRLDNVAANILTQPTLNALLALPQSVRRALRHQLFALLTDATNQPNLAPYLHSASAAILHLPTRIGDYTDFYVGIHHASNVGKQFRPENPLLANYKHLPIGYHGRASSIRLSGEPVRRPNGQRKSPDGDFPLFGPSQRLDYELELGIWIGEGNALGQPIAIADAGRHIAGICLLNDWSARDLQAWEYQPLGPFLAKNFHTTISPWLVTSEALAPFMTAQPARPVGDPQPLPYLWDATDQAGGALGLVLEVCLTTANMRAAGVSPYRLSQGQASAMYWTIAQIVTHHASNGCNLNAGDLLGTGTISGPTPDSYGSLLELSHGGKTPLTLPSGEIRSFLENGDTISLHASAQRDGYATIGFGECQAVILPAAS